MDVSFLADLRLAEPQKQKIPLQIARSAKGEISFAVPPLFAFSGGGCPSESLTGHGMPPLAVTGDPVTPTDDRVAADVQGATHGRNSPDGVAVLHLPTALWTRAARTTGFRSTSISSIIQNKRGFVKGFLDFSTDLVKIYRAGKAGSDVTHRALSYPYPAVFGTRRGRSPSGG